DGPPVTLEIGIREFQIDLFRRGGFSGMDCIGYANLETQLKGPGGEVLHTGTQRLTYFEYTTPVGFMNEVAEEALSRIYQQAAWEATVRTLQERYPQPPDPDALHRLLSAVSGTKEETVGRQRVFWLGLTAAGDPSVREGLIGLFRTSKESRIAD